MLGWGLLGVLFVRVRVMERERDIIHIGGFDSTGDKVAVGLKTLI